MKPGTERCAVCGASTVLYEGVGAYQRRTGIWLDIVGGGSSFHGAGHIRHAFWCWRGWAEWLWMAVHWRHWR